MQVFNFKNREKKSEVPDFIDEDFFTQNPPPLLSTSTPSTLKPAKKRATKKTKTKKLSDGTEIVTSTTEDEDTNTDLPMYQSNQPYSDTYNETNAMLKNSVMQIDILSNDIKNELDKIKASKTLKRKYEYISELAGTSSTLIGTKVTAIREINKTITDCHNLELKRIKDLKMDSANEQDDDKRIMDLYNAYISTPVGTYTGAMPNMSQMALSPNSSNMVTTTISQNTGDIGYDNYMNNLTPEQNMMLLESNSNAKTVVVYDQATGERHFDVVDVSTGQSIPNTPKPDEMFLRDTTIDQNKGIARNINLGQSYPLIVTNSNSTLSQY